MWHGRRGCGRAVTWAIPILLTVLGVAVAQRSEGGAMLAQASPPAPAPGGGAEGGTPPSSPAAPSTAPQAPAPPAIPTPPPGTVPGVAPSFPPLVTPSGQALATFTLHPSVGLIEEYTDNFDLSARNKRENYRTILNLGLNLLINGARAKGQVSASYGPSYDSSTGDFTGDRSASLLGRVEYEASPLLHLTVSDALTRSDEPGAADQLSLRRQRREFTSNIASVSADYRLATIATRGYYQFATFVEDQGSNTISHTAGLTATKTFLEANFASVGYEFLRSDTSGGGGEVTQHQVTASLARQLNLFTSAGISGSYAIASVDNGNDFTIGSVNVFTAYTVPGVWSVNASVGYSRFDQKSPGADSDSITTATNITYYFARATLTLGAEAGFSETFQTGQNFGVVETRGVHGSLSYPLTPFVLGTVSGFYRENRFPARASSDPARTEDTWGGAASVSVPLRAWLSLVLQYSYTKATSSLPDQGYTENRASAALTATF